MKNVNSKLQAVGFVKAEQGFCGNPYLIAFEPFKMFGRLGVKRYRKTIVFPRFTYVRILTYDDCTILFILGTKRGYQLFRLIGDELQKVTPIRYKRIEQVSRFCEIFFAYTNEQGQFDMYHLFKGKLVGDCKEYDVYHGRYIKITYVDGQQELFWLGGLITDPIIPRGNHEIDVFYDIISVTSGQITERYGNNGKKIL